MTDKGNFAVIGILFAATFWNLEAAIHSWIFHEGSFTHNFFPNTANEWWMRGLATALLVAFGIYAELSRRALISLNKERLEIQERLNDALTKKLADFIPVCAHCKAVRENEEWLSLETYVTKQTGSHFSHGLCPKCCDLYDL